MQSKIAVNASLRFVLIGAGLYLSWYFLYELILKPNTLFDEWLIDQLVVPAEVLMQWMGYQINDYSSIDMGFKSHIGVQGSLGVTVGAPCDGAPLLALFISFIFAFPGPWKHKMWFLPAGVAAIHFFNILRIIGLALIVSWNPDWLAFNHDYTFTIAIYGFVFFLWWIWITRFATKKTLQS